MNSLSAPSVVGIEFGHTLTATKGRVMTDFTRPTDSDPVVLRVWMLWKILNTLHEARTYGNAYMAASDVRKLLLDEGVSESEAYDILKSLRDVMAISTINRRGARSRRYFLEERVGDKLLSAYADYLSEKTGE